MLCPHREPQHLVDDLIGLDDPPGPQPLAAETDRTVHRQPAHPLLDVIKGHVGQRHITPARQDQRVQHRAVTGNGLRCSRRLGLDPPLGEGAEGLSREFRIRPRACYVIGDLLVEPLLRIALAAERFRVLAAAVVDVARQPRHALAVSGGGHGPCVAALVADSPGPAVLDPGPTIALHPRAPPTPSVASSDSSGLPSSRHRRWSDAALLAVRGWFPGSPIPAETTAAMRVASTSAHCVVPP